MKKMLMLPAWIAALAVVSAWSGSNGVVRGQDDLEGRLLGEEQEGVELLARGPIHEAFAEPLVENPEATLVIEMQPPDPIEEIPPEYKPEGENVVWIPGYWAWEDDREDFIWISGIWRVVPPGQRWIPGYFAEISTGWQWVPGFWMTEEEEEIVYYPTPPESLEEGPVVEAPDEDHFWVPGVWVNQTGWQWRPGYWAEYQPDWLWMPARWVWTPNGCVYLSGFWDYRPTYRGYLFAPVHFTRPIYRTAGYRYSPYYALSTPNIFVHFWVRPTYRHYYFGNYYGQDFAQYNIRPWIDYGGSARNWDPILTYNRVRYQRQGVDYVQRMSRWHDYFVTNTSYRPAVTVRQNVTLINNINVRGGSNIDIVNRINLASPLRDIARAENTALRLDRIQDRQREQIATRTERIRDVYRARLQEERREDRDRVGDVAGRPGGRDRDREGGPTGRTRLPTLDVADRTGAREEAGGRRVPGRIDQDRPTVDAARARAERAARDASRRTGDRDPLATDRPGGRDASDRVRDRDTVGRTGGRDTAGRQGGRDTTDRPGGAKSGDRPGRDVADATDTDEVDRPGGRGDRDRTKGRDAARPGATPGADLTPDLTPELTPDTTPDLTPGRDGGRRPGRGPTDPAVDGTPDRGAPGRDLDSPRTGRDRATTLPDLTPGKERPDRTPGVLDPDRPGSRPRVPGATPGARELDRPGLGDDPDPTPRRPGTGLDSDRSGKTGRPSSRDLDRPGMDRPGSDRPGASSRRPGAGLDLDRPSDRPGSATRPSGAPGIDLPSASGRTPGRSMDRPGSSSRPSARDLDRPGAGDRPGTPKLDRPGGAKLPSGLDLNRPERNRGADRPAVDRSGSSPPDAGSASRGGANLRNPRSPSADDILGGRGVDSARPTFGGSDSDTPGSSVRSRTPSPYRNENDRAGAAARREALRPAVGGAAGTAPGGVGAGFDRSPATSRGAGRRAPTGLDLDRVRGADRGGARDIPGQRGSGSPGIGVGNSLNSPGVGGPGRGSAGPSRGRDRPSSDGPGAGGPDDRTKPEDPAKKKK